MDELREAMQAAFDQHREPDIEENQTENELPDLPEPAEPPSNEPPSNEPAPQEKPVTQAKETEPAPETKEKAPQSWAPTARETWGKIPEQARQQIVKREQEVNRVLQESAGARRAMQQLQNTLAPHSQRLQAAGVSDPFQAISTLLNTEGQLRSGDTYAKAATIASLIKTYGVDVEALAGVLSGEGYEPQNGTNAELERMLSQRLAPYEQFMSQQQQSMQAAQQRQQQEATNSVAAFAQKAEFLDDVRMEMADLLDMAANRGQQMSLEEAYTKACIYHPEISKILEQRARQQQMMNTSQSAKAKRQAAVSITGQQGGTTAQGPKGLREQIAEAWSQSLDY